MYDLVPYLMRELQQRGSSALTKPGTALERLILNGEVQPPVRETSGKPATRMGPLIDGEAIRSVGSSGARGLGGSLAGLANHPLLAAVMGSVQGDMLNNHRPRMYGPSGPASPMGQVESAPMPPAAPAPQMPDFADRFGGMQAPEGLVAPMPFGGPGMTNPTPMANQGQPGMQPADNFADRFGGMQPPAAASFAERFGNMDPAVLAKGDMLRADPSQAIAMRGMPTMAQGVPMPQPRPQMAQAPMPQPRPQQAPQEMGFFQRNAAMMQDPVMGGGFIDPGAAAQAQSASPANINKMLGLLFNKANG
jgi:hypothetical protein